MAQAFSLLCSKMNSLRKRILFEFGRVSALDEQTLEDFRSQLVGRIVLSSGLLELGRSTAAQAGRWFNHAHSVASSMEALVADDIEAQGT